MIATGIIDIRVSDQKLMGNKQLKVADLVCNFGRDTTSTGESLLRYTDNSFWEGIKYK